MIRIHPTQVSSKSKMFGLHRRLERGGVAGVRRLAVLCVRAEPHRARVPHRGAEDREEGAQAPGGEEVKSPRRLL